MSRAFIYQDPIHNAIEFPGKHLNQSMRSLINTFEVQRLRHIRQNGLANLVFHGMEHSRFSHSLGVAYTARRMFDRITQNYEGEIDASLKLTTVAAALLHDIGHGPFSHTLEEILKEAGILFHHEEMTLRMIDDPSTEVHQVLTTIDNGLPKRLVPYIDKDNRPEDHWSYKLVSSEMDADRLDYVLRDAQMAGLDGTRYDLERILRMLSLHPEQPALLAIDRRATEAVESFLLALDQLYRAIYYHKTVRAATVLLKSILNRAILLQRNDTPDLFPRSLEKGQEHPLALLFSQGNEVELDDYLRLGEEHIWAMIDRWRDHSDPILQDLSNRLSKRNLPKTIAVFSNDINEATALKGKAIDLTCKTLKISSQDAKYYVTIDQPRRLTYKDKDAIWLTGRDIPPKQLQNEQNSRIIEVIKQQQDFPRVIFPSELKDEMIPASKIA